MNWQLVVNWQLISQERPSYFKYYTISPSLEVNQDNQSVKGQSNLHLVGPNQYSTQCKNPSPSSIFPSLGPTLAMVSRALSSQPASSPITHPPSRGCQHSSTSQGTASTQFLSRVPPALIPLAKGYQHSPN